MKSKLFIYSFLLVLLVGCGADEQPETTAPNSEPLVVRCNEKLPEFTLGPESNPPQEKIDQLCRCVWGKLDGWEKSTSIAIAEGREKEVSSMYLRSFPSRFGSIIDSCGAMWL